MLARLVLVPLLLAAQASAQPAGPSAISTGSLLRDMTDLAGLAEFPEPAYTCRQFSSYDRAAKSPEENWFANADTGQFLRVEERGDRKEHVLMDADGPGAIVRIWSADPKGTLRIYLDARDEPVLEAPMADLLGGKVPGIPSPLAGERSRGWNCYFPFAYARHCKVTCDEAKFYYHVNYRTYPEGTRVRTFERAALTELATEIEQVAQMLAAPETAGLRSGHRPSRLHLPETLELSAGQTKSWTAPGPAALVELRVRAAPDTPPAALRQVLLRIRFDGEDTVCCPLVDFFGAGPRPAAYASLPLGITPEGEMWSHWVMPCQKSITFGLQNLGTAPVKLSLAAREADYAWTPRTLHFGARWRGERDVPTRPMQDWNYVQLSGAGVFVGAAFAIANPVKNWWGEGDEKIYVDGETFPSHFGTGTEDYYGYAWCCNEPFTHAYHNQPRCDGPGNYGHTAVNRWHILDRIPFQQRFRFDMELWHWKEDIRVPAMSVITYGYARPGLTAPAAVPDAAALRLAELPAYAPPRVAGALEGEELAILEKTAEAAPQNIDSCSNEQHLWWRHAEPGGRLVLGFPVAQAGRYRVFIRCLKARDYGIIALSINGQAAGEPRDFYNPDITVTPELDLGEFALPAGQNRLAAEVSGANPAAAPGHMFGLDYIRLEAVP